MGKISNRKRQRRGADYKLKLLRSDSAGDKKGVVYLGHLPEGFYEKEIRQYFKQFGAVRRVKLSRSIKNGKSKGYGFIQFVDNDVAKIAAESTNNYLMFKKNLRAELMDPAKVHDNVFKGSSRQFLPRREPILRKHIYNKAVTVDPKKSALRRLSKANKKQKFLESLGYEFSNPLLTDVEKPTSSATDTEVPDSSNTKTKSKIKLPAPQKTRSSVAFPDKLAQADSDDEITFNTPPNVTKTSKVSAPAQTKSAKRKYPKTPVPTKKSAQKTKPAPVHTPPSTDVSTGASTKTYSGIKSTPSLPKSVNKSSKKSDTSELKLAKDSSSTKRPKSKMPVSDASPELRSRASKVTQKSTTQKVSRSKLTPKKNAIPVSSPKSAKKRKSAD